MTILFITTNWRETGGDWTFTREYIEIFEKKGHKVIPFAMNHEENLPSKFSADFLSKVDYSELNHNKSISNGLKVLRKSIYSTESRKKLKRIFNKFNIDIVQILNIHNTPHTTHHTPHTTTTTTTTPTPPHYHHHHQYTTPPPPPPLQHHPHTHLPTTIPTTQGEREKHK